MSQEFHGGRVREAAERFDLPIEAFIDFSSNVNVLAPVVSPVEWEQWRSEIGRYPELDSRELIQGLAKFYAVRPDYVLPTAGAIEALYLAARLFTGCKVAILEPGFSDYSRAFGSVACSVERLFFGPDLWDCPVTMWINRLEPFDVVVLGNPNNPTGSFQPATTLTEFFRRKWAVPKHWIVDEAFIEFVPDSEHETLLGSLADNASLIVLRSLTKSWCIPGLRLGFLATAGPIEPLRRMQPPWSVNGIVQAWARKFLVEDQRTTYLTSLQMLADLREDFRKSISSINGIKVYPSAANFLLLELTDSSLDANGVYRELARRGLLVRVCDSFFGMPKDRFIRVAIRSAFENGRLVATLSMVCAQLIGRAA